MVFESASEFYTVSSHLGGYPEGKIKTTRFADFTQVYQAPSTEAAAPGLEAAVRSPVLRPPSPSQQLIS